MPKLYEYLGYTFLFYSNDHRPTHVHVQRNDKEMKVEIENEQGEQQDNKGINIVIFKKIKGSHVFDSGEKKEIALLINTYREDIFKKWNRFFFEKKPISPLKINKKLKKETIISKIFNLVS
jgi:hypothetical protein